MRDLTLMIERMKKATKSKNDVELSSYLGLKSTGAISTWKYRKKIPYAECDKISQLEGVDIGYLITGEGDMHKVQSASSDDSLSYIPEYDVCLSAGHGMYPEDHALTIGNRPFATSWLQKKGLNANNLSLVRVTGDSMEPLLKDKDIIMIDSSKRIPNESMPFALRLDNSLLVKTIQCQGNGNIVLVSRNKAYDNITINQNNPPQDFQVIGAVVWHAHSWV